MSEKEIQEALKEPGCRVIVISDGKVQVEELPTFGETIIRTKQDKVYKVDKTDSKLY
jgi:hypothetical protein